MLPANPSFNYRTEIDILEMLGDDPTTMFMTYHYNGRDQSSRRQQGQVQQRRLPGEGLLGGLRALWRGLGAGPHRLVHRRREVRAVQRRPEIENGPMQLILHMMVDNDWQRDWGWACRPTLVRQLEVDYIRIYQQPLPEERGGGDLVSAETIGAFPPARAQEPATLLGTEDARGGNPACLRGYDGHECGRVTADTAAEGQYSVQ